MLANALIDTFMGRAAPPEAIDAVMSYRGREVERHSVPVAKFQLRNAVATTVIRFGPFSAATKADLFELSVDGYVIHRAPLDVTVPATGTFEWEPTLTSIDG